MSKIQVGRANATTRAADLVESIAKSPEWLSLAPAAASLAFIEVRETLRHFFDAYEANDGHEWLGILEWATIEEARERGRAFDANTAVIRAIVGRMQGHPDVEMSD